jgi:hypothetical protein
MSRFGVLSVVLLVVGFVIATGPPVTAGLIENGAFESVTGGTFDSWNYLPATAGGSVASESAAPAVLDGNYSARIVSGNLQGGRLWQELGGVAWRNFAWSLDFAVTDAGAASDRSLCFLTYSGTMSPTNPSENNVDSIRVNGDGKLQFFKGGSWTNVGDVIMSDDLDNPMLNTLQFVGENYGTAAQKFTMILNGGTPYVNTGYVNNGMVKYFSVAGHVSSVDYLVDNVSFVPEPSSVVFLSMALAGLLACTRRRRA